MSNECVELKNIKYKSMLLNGNGDEKEETVENLSNLDVFLADEKKSISNEPWTKLDKTTKLLKFNDFRNKRERAYKVGQTADLVNRHKKYMPSLMKRGVIPFPTGSQKGGDRGWQVRSYYSESQVREIRDILATHHIGRPRKDNLITNDITPSKQELTRRMGDGILTYTKTEDGRYIPVWSESI